MFAKSVLLIQFMEDIADNALMIMKIMIILNVFVIILTQKTLQELALVVLVDADIVIMTKMKEE